MISCTFENGNKANPGLRHVVIDALVLKDNAILFTKRTKKLLEGGKWGIIGGFMNINETLKQTVEREIFEETGYRVSGITLLAVIDNPNRPHEDRQNISFVFFCDAGAKEGGLDWETDEIKWFPLNELPDKEKIAFDQYMMIQLYLKYKKENLPLPLFKSE